MTLYIPMKIRRTMNLNRLFSVYRKPDFNLNLFLSNNYMCHFTVISKKIISEAGNFRSEYDGAQDYDLFLRCIEKQTE